MANMSFDEAKKEVTNLVNQGYKLSSYNPSANSARDIELWQVNPILIDGEEIVMVEKSSTDLFRFANNGNFGVKMS